MKYIVTFTYGEPIDPTNKSILNNRKYTTTIIGRCNTVKAGWAMVDKYADEHGHPKTQMWDAPISYNYSVERA